MHFGGQAEVKASTEKVWKFLTDPKAVGACIPGLQSLDVSESSEGDEYSLVVTAPLGSVRPTFELTLVYTLVEPPTTARMRIRGKGPNTRIGASSLLTLKSAGEGSTEMSWSFNLAAFGLVANLGERVIGHVFEQLSDEFIASVKERLEA